MAVEVGVHGFGAYLPPLRLDRAEVAAANAWLTPGQKPNASGARAVAGWDEDAITLGVEAARDALYRRARTELSGLFVGSTTLPFADRLNSAVVAGALGLEESVTCQDVTGSQRAGTSALLAAADAVRARGSRALAVAAEKRIARPGAGAEMTVGHGSAAVLVGPGAGLARLAGSASLTVDFVDHYRPAGERFDYRWEDRWVRDEGYLKLVPAALRVALEDAGVSASKLDHLCVPPTLPGVGSRVAASIGADPRSAKDELLSTSGETGAAHPLVMLAHALENAKAGDWIAVAGFGQGADALVFEVMPAIDEEPVRGQGVSQWIPRVLPLSYPRYLALSGLIEIDHGIRGEADKSTALTALYRHRDLLHNLTGGYCERCGTHQIPRLKICVNPDCRAIDSQVPHSFAESRARVVSWSADNLTYTPDPPAYYGMVDFEEGGRLMLDFADVGTGAVEVGAAMRMVFRVKDHDLRRGFTRYFWKAAPARHKEA